MKWPAFNNKNPMLAAPENPPLTYNYQIGGFPVELKTNSHYNFVTFPLPEDPQERKQINFIESLLREEMGKIYRKVYEHMVLNPIITRTLHGEESERKPSTSNSLHTFLDNLATHYPSPEAFQDFIRLQELQLRAGNDQLRAKQAHQHINPVMNDTLEWLKDHKLIETLDEDTVEELRNHLIGKQAGRRH